MEEQKIVYKSLDEIKPYKNNPRINKDAIEKVALSIKKYGFRNPIILDKKNEIICGHTRYEASKKLGLIKVPCIIIDDLTEKQIRELRLVDNKTSELSYWDFDKLYNEIEEFSLEVFDFGFKDFNLNSNNIFENDKSSEIDLDEFFEEFEHECPKCGYKF